MTKRDVVCVGDVRVVFDEALVEPTKAEEGADAFDTLGRGPNGDGLDLLGLFLNTRREYNRTAKVKARLCKEIFAFFFAKICNALLKCSRDYSYFPI